MPHTRFVFTALAALHSTILLAPPVFADGVVVSLGDADGLYGSPSIDLGAFTGGTAPNSGHHDSTQPGNTEIGVPEPPPGLSWSAGSGVEFGARKTNVRGKCTRLEACALIEVSAGEVRFLYRAGARVETHQSCLTQIDVNVRPESGLRIPAPRRSEVVGKNPLNCKPNLKLFLRTRRFGVRIFHVKSICRFFVLSLSDARRGGTNGIRR
ncbi:hypothetical protein OOZ19_04275 [Saccharopolyspora sp. NFXS83]|nr:hypothetical protein [Saccharopolyspora sp. NFXS83]MCX2729445.1 hypothetical protein [Saccharopolyspora sp. NFXS83]